MNQYTIKQTAKLRTFYHLSSQNLHSNQFTVYIDASSIANENHIDQKGDYNLKPASVPRTNICCS